MNKRLITGFIIFSFAILLSMSFASAGFWDFMKNGKSLNEILGKTSGKSVTGETITGAVTLTLTDAETYAEQQCKNAVATLPSYSVQLVDGKEQFYNAPSNNPDNPYASARVPCKTDKLQPTTNGYCVVKRHWGSQKTSLGTTITVLSISWECRPSADAPKPQCVSDSECTLPSGTNRLCNSAVCADGKCAVAVAHTGTVCSRGKAVWGSYDWSAGGVCDANGQCSQSTCSSNSDCNDQLKAKPCYNRECIDVNARWKGRPNYQALKTCLYTPVKGCTGDKLCWLFGDGSDATNNDCPAAINSGCYGKAKCINLRIGASYPDWQPSPRPDIYTDSFGNQYGGVCDYGAAISGCGKDACGPNNNCQNKFPAHRPETTVYGTTAIIPSSVSGNSPYNEIGCVNGKCQYVNYDCGGAADCKTKSYNFIEGSSTSFKCEGGKCTLNTLTGGLGVILTGAVTANSVVTGKATAVSNCYGKTDGTYCNYPGKIGDAMCFGGKCYFGNLQDLTSHIGTTCDQTKCGTDFFAKCLNNDHPASCTGVNKSCTVNGQTGICQEGYCYLGTITLSGSSKRTNNCAPSPACSVNTITLSDCYKYPSGYMSHQCFTQTSTRPIYISERIEQCFKSDGSTPIQGIINYYDSDLGINPYIQGIVAGKNGIKQDSCTDSNTLIEYWTLGSEILNKTIICEKGCVNGACTNSKATWQYTPKAGATSCSTTACGIDSYIGCNPANGKSQTICARDYSIYTSSNFAIIELTSSGCSSYKGYQNLGYENENMPICGIDYDTLPTIK